MSPNRLTIAAASIAEVENHLEDGVDRKLFAREEIAEALTLCRRAGSARGGARSHPPRLHLQGAGLAGTEGFRNPRLRGREYATQAEPHPWGSLRVRIHP